VRIGSTEWCNATNGELRWRDKFTILASAAVEVCKMFPDERRAKHGKARAVGSIEVDDIVLPDTAAARDAEGRLQAIADPYMINHSVRTYVWSHILGELDGLRFDHELLYVASIMHDVALFEPHLGGPGKPACFAIRGANEARAVGARAEWAPEKQNLLAECITHHVNPVVPLEVSTEAHLMNRGVLLDVIGARYWTIGEGNRESVVRRWPREQLKRNVWDIFSKEARDQPRCRGMFAVRWLQFEARVRRAPFDE